MQFVDWLNYSAALFAKGYFSLSHQRCVVSQVTSGLKGNQIPNLKGKEGMGDVCEKWTQNVSRALKRAA